MGFIEEIVVYTGNQTIGKQLLRALDACQIERSAKSLQDAAKKDDTPNDGELLLKPLVNLVQVRDKVRSRRKTLSGKRTHSVAQQSAAVTKALTLKFSVLDYDPKVFAEQLTAFHHQQFRDVPEIELLQQRYSKDKAPGVGVVSAHFNRLGGWILNQVLANASLDERANTLRHLLSVCVHLYQLQNYNGTVAIIAAMNNSAIDRLRITWDTLGRPTYLVKEAFAALLHDNYSAYRKELKEITPPCIPFLGMFLTDLTFLEDGNPNFVDHDKVNYSKFVKISNTVQQIINFQEFSYHDLTLDDDFAALFQRFTTLSETEAFSRSEKIEPRKITCTVRKFGKLTPSELKEIEVIRSKIKSKEANSLEDLIRTEETEAAPDIPLSARLKSRKHSTARLRRNTVLG